LGSESGVEELADEDSSDNENKGSNEETEAATTSSVIENPQKKTKIFPDIDENSEQPVLNKEGITKRLRILRRRNTLSTIKEKNLSKNKVSLKILVPGKDGSIIFKSR
jgi:hypothetical protein